MSFGVSPPLRDQPQPTNWYLWSKWFSTLYDRLGPGPFKIPSYAKADLPSATKWQTNGGFSGIILVEDEIGGATLAFSDGTNWRRVQDRVIVS